MHWPFARDFGSLDGHALLHQAASWAGSLSNLIELSGEGLTVLSATVIASLITSNTATKSLNLQCNRIGDDGAGHLSEALKKNSTLKDLNRASYIGAEGAKHFSEALKMNSTLKELQLSANNIRPSGAMHLSEALKKNSTLQTLDLNDNALCGIQNGQGTYTAAGIAKIAEMLKVNTTLQSTAPRTTASVRRASSTRGAQHVMVGHEDAQSRPQLA